MSEDFGAGSLATLLVDLYKNYPLLDEETKEEIKSMEIKPIETHYKGYRFRSRLEAKWAVFFETLRLKWEYEKEGFVLPNHINYLPDFWIDDLQIFIEIKPAYPSPTEEDKLDWMASGDKPIALFYGLPNENYGLLRCMEVDDGGGGIYYADSIKWLSDSSNKRIALCNVNDTRERQFYADMGCQISLDKIYNRANLPSDYSLARYVGAYTNYLFTSMCNCLIDNAAGSAKSARFEHGEQP